MRTFAFSVLAVGLGCASASAGAARDPEEPAAAVEYSSTAEENFDRAEKEFADEDWLEATSLFEHVKNRYPYSRRAADAELRLADVLFEQAKYIDAEEAYRSFVKLHPGHAKVDYAAFRVGLCHHKDIPSDHFFLPPSYEKDQADVRQAARALSDFVAGYPQSEHRAEAEALIKDCTRRLAEHEMYVASFYERRSKMRAAAGRLERALTELPQNGHDDEMLVRLGKVYLALGEKDKARGALERLVKEFPQSHRIGEAQDLLKSL